MTEDKPRADGQCRCGRVDLQVAGAPLLTMACHCTGCQKMTASAFSISALYPADALVVIGGNPVIGGLHGMTRHYFCEWCKSWLFTRPEGLDDLVNVRSTMFADLADAPPFVEVWTGKKRGWAQTGAVHSYVSVPDPSEWPTLMAAFAEDAGGR